MGWYDYGARMYNPNIGRFNGVDRFAEKYQSATPYHYTLNNPILFIDVNGDSIIIKHRKEEIYYKIRANGSSILLTKSGHLYDGKAVRKRGRRAGELKGFVASVKNGLDQLRDGGNMGNSLVNEISSDPNVVNIVQGSPDGVGSGGNSFSPSGRKFTVSWNPSWTKGGLDINGGVTRPTFIGLGHELAHAYDAISDLYMDQTLWVGLTERSELFASHVENLIRVENGIALRSNYSNSNHPDYRLLNSQGQSYHYYSQARKENLNVSVRLMGLISNLQIRVQVPAPFDYHKDGKSTVLSKIPQ